MTNAKKLEILTLLSTLLDIEQPAKKFTPKSSYKAANKFTPKGKIASDGKTERQLQNEVAVANAFKKKGLIVTPRVDALSFKEWQKKGFTVKEGEKGLFVKRVGFMFHSGQVAPTQQISLITGQPVVQVAA